MLYDSQIPSDLYSFSHHRNSTRLDLDRIGALKGITGQGLWGTVDEMSGTKMGLGLPLSNIYATYFGGTLDLVSSDGWGRLSSCIGEPFN